MPVMSCGTTAQQDHMSWAEGQFRESHSLQQKMPLQGPSQQRLLSPSSQWRAILFNRFDFSGERYLSSANASSMSVRVTTYSHSSCAHSHLGSSRDSQEGLFSLAFYFALQDTSATWQKKKDPLKGKRYRIPFFCHILRNFYSFYNIFSTQSVPPTQLTAPKLTKITIERYTWCATELSAPVLYLVWVLDKDDYFFYWYLTRVFIYLNNLFI